MALRSRDCGKAQVAQENMYGVANGYIVSVTNVTLNQTTTFTRDPTSNHITRIVDPLGRTADLR